MENRYPYHGGPAQAVQRSAHGLVILVLHSPDAPEISGGRGLNGPSFVHLRGG